MWLSFPAREGKKICSGGVSSACSPQACLVLSFFPSRWCPQGHQNSQARSDSTTQRMPGQLWPRGMPVAWPEMIFTEEQIQAAMDSRGRSLSPQPSKGPAMASTAHTCEQVTEQGQGSTYGRPSFWSQGVTNNPPAPQPAAPQTPVIML